MNTFTFTIQIKANSPLEAQAKFQSLQTLGNNLTKDNLVFIADKATKPDVNNKIDKFKSGPFKNYL